MDSDSPIWDVRGWKRLTVHEDPPLPAVREEILAWLAEVPELHRVDLDARLRSGLDHAHLSACLELFVHHYFLSNVWEVEIHPQVPHSSNRPDFRVSKVDDTLLVECKSILDRAAIAKQEQRLRQLSDEVSKKLGRTVVLHPLSELPPSIPVGRIRAWIEQQELPDDGPGFLEFDFWDDHQGHHFGVRAIVLKLSDGGEGLDGVQGLISQAETVTNAMQLRAALREKASKYGSLDIPYMIAISGETSFPMTSENEVDAMFGDRVWNIALDGASQVTETRSPNGFFNSLQNGLARHRDVSAVLVYRFKWIGEGHEHRMHIYHNPNANRPIDPSLFPNIPQLVHDATTTMWINGKPEPY